jgi:hypothetical protein
MDKQAPALALVLVLATITAGLGAAPVAADDGGVLDGLLGDDDTETSDSDDGLLSQVSRAWDAVRGGVVGLQNRVVNFGDEQAASTTADELQAFINEHNATLQQYINTRTTASTSLDVVKVEINGARESRATRFLVADVADGNYTSGRMVASTDRTVDETITIDGQATAHAVDELKTVYDDYVSQDRDLDTRLLSRLTSQYRTDLTASFFPL